MGQYIKFWYLSTKSPTKAHIYVYGGARGLNFGLSLHLYLYSVQVSSKGSGESVLMPRLARVFAAGQCNKYISSYIHLWGKL